MIGQPWADGFGFTDGTGFAHMAFAGGTPASLAELETRLAALELIAGTTKEIHYGEGVPAPALGKDNDLYLDIGGPTSTGLTYAKSGGAWTSTGFQAWKA